MDLFYKLEYNQIIQIIEKYCKTYLGKKQSREMQPSFSFEQVQNLLSESMECLTFLYQKGAPPFTELPEMELYLKALQSSQILSTKALLSFGSLLKSARELKQYCNLEKEVNSLVSPQELQKEDSKILENSTGVFEKYFSTLYTNPSIEKEIFSKILDQNTISDSASSKLASLRRNRKNLEQTIKDKLNSYLHSSTYSKYLMEPVITIRNNRYVIPVKNEYRSTISGFIHDISSSGSTVYLEPTSIFETNNQIASLKIEEEIEIEKILQNLSILLYDYVEELQNNLSLIGQLDLLFAKAQFAKQQDGIMPILNQEKKVNLKKAKHPLIDSKVVVPIDISLGEDYHTLIITGPNTGGKTVALKTLGLLLLMAYSGIPIPCSEQSTICIFDHIFVDIGDEQNIQESLSTFSSHMLNIVKITKQVTQNSLVLLDELGSGTDPIEGANLAISILQHFANIGALTACTTHYQELKEFALITDGFENASFEFDVENLKPTYHLLLGIPGKSNAFEISKKLGLSQEIIDRASALVKQDHVSIEELLKSIYEDKLAIEKQKQESEKNLNQIEVLRKSLENDQSDLLQKRQKMLENAKVEARDILFSAKEDAIEILRQLHEEQTDSKKANRLRNKLNEKIKEIGNGVNSSDFMNHFPESFRKNSENIQTLSSFLSSKKQPIQGLKVWIASLQTDGIVISKQANKSNEVQVQVGLAKMNLKTSELILLDFQHSNFADKSLNSENKNSNFKNKTANPMNHTSGFLKGTVTTQKQSKAQFVSPEINVIGQTVDDAIYVIDKYLDNCAMSNLSPVRIVHGKGTGKLREGIQQYLKRNPHIKSFRLGTFGEGEMGVTVVELK